MKIYLATNNEHKKREMTQLFSEHKIVIPKDENIDFFPNETGATFYENSLIKAKELFKIVNAPVMADDSGICVDALDGLPGIFSSRYKVSKNSENKITQQMQNEFLIQELNDTLKKYIDFSNFKNGKRSAHYTCSIVLYLGSDRIFVSQDTMEGAIVESIEDAKGSGGFGYDPIFYLPQLKKTAAELSSEEKNKISHRGKASYIMKNIIEKLEIK